MRFAATIYTFLALMCVPGFAVAQANKLTDPQIAHIAYTAGQIDIQATQVALKKSKSKEVRDFATQMERDHKAVNDKALALLNKLKMKPEDNESSSALTKQASDSRAALTQRNGARFEKAYIQHEVDYHKAVNDTLQNTLIPGAPNQ